MIQATKTLEQVVEQFKLDDCGIYNDDITIYRTEDAYIQPEDSFHAHDCETGSSSKTYRTIGEVYKALEFESIVWDTRW